MRACFQLHVKPERLEEYKARHSAVWPQMRAALVSAGWRNYSLFLRADGLLIGYVETDSLEEAVAAMDRTEVNARWQAEMAEFFCELDGQTPDHGFTLLDEVFHLEESATSNHIECEK
ncbi:MAG: L-rhamnose mutarotase [Nocardioides sp.]|uniref:L-rhamnose mutarotase n=1 Tax=Nocardioides sp. TaxID=35761 RepID=UPI0039E4B18D